MYMTLRSIWINEFNKIDPTNLSTNQIYLMMTTVRDYHILYTDLPQSISVIISKYAISLLTDGSFEWWVSDALSLFDLGFTQSVHNQERKMLLSLATTSKQKQLLLLHPIMRALVFKSKDKKAHPTVKIGRSYW